MLNNSSNSQPTSSDERTMAALAHGSILLGILTSGIGGIVAALVIWLTQRDKSRYVAFQALQATIYQLVGIIVFGALALCWALTIPVSLFPAMINPSAYRNAPPPTMWIALALGCIPFTIGLVWTLYGVWGALRTWSGADFRYPVISKLTKV